MIFPAHKLNPLILKFLAVFIVVYIIYTALQFHNVLIPNVQKRRSYQDYLDAPSKTVDVRRNFVTSNADIHLLDAIDNATKECKFRYEHHMEPVCHIPHNRRLTKDMSYVHWETGEPLKIFFVPHSHNDAGWIYTYNMYYDVFTREILNHVVEHLTNNPDLRFIWAEISFFTRWWEDPRTTDRQRAQVKRLLETKQLEFVGGGWVMPDEALVHYYSYLTQLTEGRQWLQTNLNCSPTNGWSIDPFGLSQSFSHLQALSGIENTVIGRVHFELKNYLAERKALEFEWQSEFPSSTISLFTHVLPYSSYDTATTCGPDIDVCKVFDANITDSIYMLEVAHREGKGNITKNLDDRSLELLEQFRKQAMLLKTRNVLIPLGGDFKWNSDYEWNQGMDYVRQIMGYINSRENLNTIVKFGTLAEYFETVKKDISAGGSLDIVTGDFFPYADIGENYWSGYFTSRIFHKILERQLMALVRSSQLALSIVIAEVRPMTNEMRIFVDDLYQNVVASRRTLSLIQHHDAIAGTSKDHVMLDYAERMQTALNQSQFVTMKSVEMLAFLRDGAKHPIPNPISNNSALEPILYNLGQEDSWAARYIQLDEENPLAMIGVFNPLTDIRHALLRFNVSTAYVRVFTSDGINIPWEIFPRFQYDPKNQEMVAYENQYELVITMKILHLQVKSFYIGYNPKAKESDNPAVQLQILNAPANFSDNFRHNFNYLDTLKNFTKATLNIANEQTKLVFDYDGGLLSAIVDGVNFDLQLTLQYYSTYSSGLYLFRPSRPFPTPIASSKPVIVIARGNLQSYVQVYYDTVVSKITLEGTNGGISVENVIDLRAQKNYELIMRLQTSIKSQDIFYTDSNGFQMMKRKRMEAVPTEGNYYPMATAAFIESAGKRLTVLGAQPGGAASLAPGQLEIMLDRIVNQDDSHGVGQDGDDNVVVRSLFQILLETENSQPNLPTRPSLSLEAHHRLHHLLFPPQLFLFRTPPVEGINFGYEIKKKNAVPCDIHLLGSVLMDTASPSGAPSTGILVHRLESDPRYGVGELAQICDVEEDFMGTFFIGNVFGNLFQETELEKMSLTLTEDQEELTSVEGISLAVMEVVAFRLKYTNADEELASNI